MLTQKKERVDQEGMEDLEYLRKLHNVDLEARERDF